MLNPFDDAMMADACATLAHALEQRGVSFLATARELRREERYFRDRHSSRSTKRMFAVLPDKPPPPPGDSRDPDDKG